jgi:hypothetical protein
MLNKGEILKKVGEINNKELMIIVLIKINID